MQQDTIPSRLFPDDDANKQENKPKKSSKVGLWGILLIGMLVALGSLAIARIFHRLFG